MRTTIELTDEQRARLLEIAASRGEKGFSHLVREAVDMYLRAQRDHDDAIRGALRLKGRLSDEEAENLEAATQELRASWR